MERVLYVLSDFQAIIAAHPHYAITAHKEFLKIPEYCIALPDDIPGAMSFTGEKLIRFHDEKSFDWLDAPVDAVEASLP